MKTKTRWLRFLSLMVILTMLIPTASFAFSSGVPNPLREGAVVPQLNADKNPPGRIAESPTGLYIVRLTDASLASYRGGIQGLAATSPLVTGSRFVDVDSAAGIAYRNYLEGRQGELLRAMETTLGRSVEVRYQYLNVLNGVAVALNATEAARIAQLPGVVSVTPDAVRALDTEVSVDLIGAPEIWNGNTPSGLGTQGEGVIVGVIDSGINHDHPSFAATGGDGYTHTNPFGTGNSAPGDYCNSVSDICNDKLIGAWVFNGTSPEDTDGHGSHTASTSAGNVHTATITVGSDIYDLLLKGVAPHANVIAYKVCNPGCPDTASVSAVDQAIVDRSNAGGLPMVLNYSISGVDNPWNDNVDLAFLDAFNAGIFVSASAGNDGPGASTLAKSGGWNLTVGASTTNRVIANTVDVTGPGTPPVDLTNLAAVTGSGPAIVSDIAAPILWAGDVSPGNEQGCTAFPANAFLNKIALIQRGACDFATKVGNAQAARADAVIVYNNVSGPPISMGGLEATTIPAVFIDVNDGLAVQTWASANLGTATARINAGTSYIQNDAWEDIMAGFSSRGPSQFNILKPDVTAPGVNILAAYCCGNEYDFLQGTSMSSPHGAGSAALLMALHPTWSPAKIKSALSSTAVTNPVPLDGSTANILKEDGVNAADWFDLGGGRIDLVAAAYAGLVLDETYTNFLNANPDTGGDPRTLNLPAMQDNACVGSCSWTRTVSSTLPVTTTWTVTYSVPVGMGLAVTPSSFDLSPYGTQVIDVTADVTGLAVGAWAFAELHFHGVEKPSGGGSPLLHLVKEDGGITAEPGDTVTYTLTYSNTGTASATGVMITDTVPTNTTFNAGASTVGWTQVGASDVYTFSVGTLSVGGTNSVNFVVDVDDPFPGGSGTITNTASLGDDGTASASDTDTTPVQESPPPGSPVLHLVKDDGGITAEPGDTVTYTLSYSNTGTASATGVVITDTVPTNTTFNAGASTVGWIQVGVSDVYTLSIGTLAIGGTNSVNFAVDVDDPFPGGSGTITNTASLGDDGTASASDTDTTPVQESPPPGSPVLHLVKDDGGITAEPGDTVSYTLSYSNTGDTGAVGVVITETVPANSTFNASISTTGWSQVGASDTYTFGVGTLAANASGSVVFAVDVDDPFPGGSGTLTNTAVIGDDTTANAASDSETTPVETTPPPTDEFVVYLPFVSKEGTSSILQTETTQAEPIPLQADALVISDAHFPIAVLVPPASITIAPDSLSSIQEIDDVLTKTFTLSNVGTGDLIWSLEEDQVTAPSAVDWFENFDSYTNGTNLHGVGGWKGWDNTPAATAFVTDVQANSAPHSVDINTTSDLVHEYTGYTSGTWAYTLWQYIPGSYSGDTYLILLNQYSDGGDTNYSVQVHFDSATGKVENTGDSGGSLDYVTDQWVEIRVEIDLDSDTQFFYYNNQLLYFGTWTGEVSGAGQLEIQAVDLFANGAGSVYYDDISLVAEPISCSVADNIPWATIDPINGTTASGNSELVEVSFDSTGLSVGSYNGVLCVTSNDPNNGLSVVSLHMEVVSGLPNIVVAPTTLDNTQAPDANVQQTLTLSNTGTAVLNWSIDEDNSTSGPVLPAGLPILGTGAIRGETLTIGDKVLGYSGIQNGLSVTPPSAPSAGTTITHSASQTIASGNSVACTDNITGFHTDNSYLRSFDLSSFGITGNFNVTSVEFGIESAVGAGGDQPVTVNLYTWDGISAFTFANLTSIGTASVNVSDQTLTVYNIPVTGLAPSGTFLVVEIFTPDGSDGNSFFVGSNTGGQTALSYIAAADCGLTEPTDLAGIGYADMHIVMNVTGDTGPVACDIPEDIPWLSLDLTSGSINVGLSTDITVTFDSTGLTVGTYNAALCVNTNDLDTPLVEVPVTLTVSSP